MGLSTAQEQIKERFIALHGTWGDGWESILVLDPEFLVAYLDLSAVPHLKHALDAQTRALVGVALNAAATQLHVPGIRQHIRAALAAGARAEEVMEVLEITATLGVHGMNTGVLVGVLEERGLRTAPAALTPEQEAIKARYTDLRGYWMSFLDEHLELAPEHFAAYTEFSSHPWRHGVLAPKVKELIYIAFDTSPTHLHRTGLKVHIENAIGYGATPQEILEVMELSTLLGMHAVTVGAPILREELERAAAEAGSPQP